MAYIKAMGSSKVDPITIGTQSGPTANSRRLCVDVDTFKKYSKMIYHADFHAANSASIKAMATWGQQGTSIGTINKDVETDITTLTIPAGTVAINIEAAGDYSEYRVTLKN